MTLAAQLFPYQPGRIETPEAKPARLATELVVIAAAGRGRAVECANDNEAERRKFYWEED